MADNPIGKIHEVTGTLLTEVVCPPCGYRFRLEGDCDRVIIECPDCGAELRVTRQ